jgi:hypothetical protein
MICRIVCVTICSLSSLGCVAKVNLLDDGVGSVCRQLFFVGLALKAIQYKLKDVEPDL